MRKKIETLIIFMLLISVTTTCFSGITKAASITTTNSNTYYVSQTGNDNNAGTISSPWKTLQKAANTVNAGDTVFVRGGTYNERVTISHSGTSDKWITFKNYQNEIPIIDGTGKGSSYWAGGTLEVSSTSYVLVDGFKVQNTPKSGICVLRSQHITIQNCQTTHTGMSGIRVCYGEGTSKKVYCDNIKILNNIISSAVIGSPKSQETLTFSGVSNSEIRGNTLDSSNKYEGIDCKHNCNHITIAYNDVSTGGVNIYVGGAPDGPACGDFEVYGNYCHGKGNSIGISCEQIHVGNNFYFYNNILASATNGFALYEGGQALNGPSNVQFINNIFNVGNYGIRCNPFSSTIQMKNVVIRNNIFRCSGIQLNSNQPSSQLTVDHNLFTGSSTLYGTAYIKEDPKFVSTTNYHLQSTSPCINKGSSTGAPNFDYEGYSRPQDTTIDIGAYEYGSTTIVDVVEFKRITTSTTTPTTTPTTTTPTSVVAPTIITNTATSITSNSAVLKSNLGNMGGASSCEVWFQYGTTTSYGSTTTHQQVHFQQT
jgi:hypothetical protein